MKQIFTKRLGIQVLLTVVALLAIAVIVPGAFHHGAGFLGLGMVPMAGMMIDSQCQLMVAQAFTTGTTVSTNTYDTGSATRDISVGEPICVAFTIDVSAKSSTGDETYTFEVIQSATADLATPTVIAQAAVLRTTLLAGYAFYLPIPSGTQTQRYLGAQLILGGTTPTVTATAELQPLSMVQRSKIYTVGYLIDS